MKQTNKKDLPWGVSRMLFLFLVCGCSQIYAPELFAGATANDGSSFIGELTGDGNVGDLISVDAGFLVGSRTENDLTFLVNQKGLLVYNVSSQNCVLSFPLNSLPCSSLAIGRVNSACFICCQDSVWRVVLRPGLAPGEETVMLEGRIDVFSLVCFGLGRFFILVFSN
jgi:hypothetical protein